MSLLSTSKAFSLVLVTVFLSLSSRAALHPFEGDITIVDLQGDSLGTSIQVGDIFHFSLTYDDSVVDSNPSLAVGVFFPASLAGGTLTRMGGTGTWDPASGTLSAGYVTTQHGPGADDFFISNTGSGFASANGIPFDYLSVGLQASDTQRVFDTGAGQTISQQLLGQSLTSFPWEFGFGEINFYDGNLVSAVANFEFAPVPEPSVWALGLAGLIIFGIRRSSRSRQQAIF